MSYLAVKYFHMSCAAASGILFLVRGIWMLRGSPNLRRPWVKIFPHVIDSLLLGSALVLVWWSGQYPFARTWLTAKLFALLLYIALGSVALKYGKTRTIRVAAFAGAVATFMYIAGVALSKDPIFFLSY